MSNDDLGTQIQKYRKQNKLSQTELALLVGVSQPTIAAWELGSSSPSGIKRDVLFKLISAKKEDFSNESEHLKEIIQGQKTIIELLKDKIRGLGGNV